MQYCGHTSQKVIKKHLPQDEGPETSANPTPKHQESATGLASFQGRLNSGYTRSHQWEGHQREAITIASIGTERGEVFS
jgi:hypothetical protein